MWKKSRGDQTFVRLLKGKENGPIFDSFFACTDNIPILYFKIDRNAIHLIIPKGPVTISSSLLDSPIKDDNIINALDRLDKQIGLKLLHNKNTKQFEYPIIFDSISLSKDGLPLLHFETDRGVIQIEIPDGEVKIWYTPLYTETIKGKNIFIAFEKFYRRIGVKGLITKIN